MKAEKTSDTVVVIPTYCERDNIGEILPAVLGALPCDVLVVDDDSPDRTAAVAEELLAREPRGRVIVRRDRPRGLGRAYVDGFKQVLDEGYAFVLQMDADFSHRPEDLPRLREAAGQADLVIGSRYVRGGETHDWGLVRKWISRGGSWYARILLGLGVRDVTGGFKCWRAEALRRLNLDSISSTGFAFQIEMNYRAHQRGLRILEVPIRFDDRVRGDSKMSTRIFLEGLTAVWRIRFLRGK